ncbi:MAG: hypothetical protein HC880_04190 [Bacteroidia bacterium]|nr:hypothetical protein [Bacteroidia bacterium]
MNYLNTAGHSQNNHRWITLSYEKLVLRGLTEMEGLFGRLNLPLPPSLSEAFYQPSQSTRHSRWYFKNSSRHLSRWQETLRPEQITRILAVVRALGIDAYNEQVEPDYTRLENSGI